MPLPGFKTLIYLVLRLALVVLASHFYLEEAGAETTKIAAGVNHTVSLKDDGTVWAWGENGYGQLGTGNNTSTTVPITRDGPIP